MENKTKNKIIKHAKKSKNNEKTKKTKNKTIKHAKISKNSEKS